MWPSLLAQIRNDKHLFGLQGSQQTTLQKILQLSDAGLSLALEFCPRRIYHHPNGPRLCALPPLPRAQTGIGWLVSALAPQQQRTHERVPEWQARIAQKGQYKTSFLISITEVSLTFRDVGLLTVCLHTFA